jgi:phosphoadenosine phosphosulfate reductase
MSDSAFAPSTLNYLLETRLVQVMQDLCTRYSKLAFASSLGLEDMLLTDVIARHKLPIDLFTLDTGRLHEETYQHLAKVARHYSSLKVRTVAAQAQALEDLVAGIGINGFYDSLDARRSCCAVRKIEPLRRALADSQAWITGLRREQSEARTALTFESQDPLSGLPKYNPLLEWTSQAVQDYLERYQVPVNALHAQGYPSIGCAPCTRAIKPGEHPRAGRWWWEAAQATQQECGLHLDNSGRLIRAQHSPDQAGSQAQHVATAHRQETNTGIDS